MNNLLSQIRNKPYIEANTVIRELSGIVNYFSSADEKNNFISDYEYNSPLVCEDRASYGDWQTPESLADKICQDYLSKYGEPDIVIEPTCGLGAFVFSSLSLFSNLSEIHALEINRQYTNDLKFRLLINAINNPSEKHPDIYIYTEDFFKFDFSQIINKAKGRTLAIIGNPPWVTNSSQGKNNSLNIPHKQNHFGLKGIDAITGKSNFDISEYITLSLLKLSQHNRGGISFLLKNSVIRNILSKQKIAPINITDIEQKQINASSEFNVSVDASCFSARFGDSPSMNCKISNFYSKSYIREFGWVANSFVSDTELYRRFSIFDGNSNYIWRSGIKHDCASVLELSLSNGIYVNGFGEEVLIEEDLIYPLLKSSDIRKYEPEKIKKYIIVPQHKIGEETSMLKYTHPKTYSYLMKYEELFNKRKSSIYKGKEKFSIFGLGEYSFKPYKIVVSSLYKTINFILVSEYGGKPVMVDDTCYQLDFDSKKEAENIYRALQSDEIQSLLASITFLDAKRVVTKNILMRLNLVELCRQKGIILDSDRFNSPVISQASLFDL